MPTSYGYFLLLLLFSYFCYSNLSSIPFLLFLRVRRSLIPVIKNHSGFEFPSNLNFQTSYSKQKLRTYLYDSFDDPSWVKNCHLQCKSRTGVIDEKKTFVCICVFPVRSKSTIIPLRRWEVLPEQVVFDKEIGCGAFGKVFKGSFKESPGIEAFYEPRSETVDFQAGRTVAIKILGGK